MSSTHLRRAGTAALVAAILALGFNLRGSIASLPPLFPELSRVLHLSAAELSVLGAVPVLCFGLFSPVAAPLSRRFGEERVLGAALIVLAAGLLLRGSAPLLFPGTVVACCAIALMNVLVPSLVMRRRPDRAGLLIGLYLTALSTGGIVGPLIAVPLFDAAGGGSRATSITVALWAVPALAAAVVWLPQLRFRALPESLPAGERGRLGALAMTRRALAWQVAAFMGLQSLSYYAVLSWFPTLFRDRGVSAAQAGALVALMNLGNAVTALLFPVLAHRIADQRKLAAISTLATGSGLAGAAFGPLGTAPWFMFLLGLGQGATLGLGIFYTMARAADPMISASLSAFAQGTGYLIASAGPLLIGLLHATSGGWALPVWTLLALAVLQLAAGWLAGRPKTINSDGRFPGRVSAPESA
ncbi:MAG TPA: MFS transporter [Streptosporangiaceae bacterium]|nr:MFS transporter [Streptosporangiaceae bacterium]